ncbi:lysophospholipid acyltransferase family protein [Blattabacterium cuenoti]|uniref:1-acyl-sn-glycerol-3-phosphate acyltransferase n=1 Tax=Blattabacterium cuenoti BPAA TaxID=1229512 RepID=M4ZSU2_9FLAO|nr:lysophospholipid acyltransferase family protein [Blattabacterium cuenoti]BAM99433.1 1-acyl-sn-glycerol-3-phosphate acyltransferase [Blattabacterium cuenoti BPAA]
MKIIKISLILLWRTWFFLINIFLIPLWAGASIPFLFKEKHYPIAYWFHQMWAKSNLFFMGFWYVLEKDKEILDKNQQYVIISNHSSIMDIMLIYSLMKNHPLVFVGKAELAKLPFFGFVYKKSNILIDRKNLSSCIQVFKKIEDKVDSGKSVCIFPEGGVPKPYIFLDHFKSGAFFIAIIKKIPIIPFTIADIKTKFPSSSIIKGGPGKIRIKQHHSISTKNLSLKDKNFLKEKCFNLIKYQLEKFEREKENN